MSGKIIISIISLILVVGVAIGVIVTVHKKGEDPQIQTQQRYITVICQNAEDQKLCNETLSSVGGADAADPKAYVVAAVKAATDTVIKAFNMTDRLTVEYGDKDSHTKMVVDGCKKMMQFALDSLDLSTIVVRDKNIQSVHAQNADLRNWLSAVISYKQACMEGFDDEKEDEKKIKEQLQSETIDRATKVTIVALDIVSDLSNILQEFGLKLDLKPSSRRLLSEEIDNEEGLPTWISATDRKLLAQMQGRTWRSKFPPNVVVAKDGTGQFKTIVDAIKSYPKGNKERYIIYVKAGVYDEQVIVPKECVNLLMYGDGPQTIVTGQKNKKKDNISILENGSFSNEATGFIAKDMKFQNTAGPSGEQAVALRNLGDMSAFFGCHFWGYQDTLWAQSNRQFYSDCVIYGTIDFIFGTSRTLIQNSKIYVMKPNKGQFNIITADGTEIKNHPYTGIVIQGCQIESDGSFSKSEFKSYLGRPYKIYARTMIMESTIGDFIESEGYYPWIENGTQVHMNTCDLFEYKNTGPGANTANRVDWPGYHSNISQDEARDYTAAKWLEAGPVSGTKWFKGLHFPHYLGFNFENKHAA